MQSEDDRDLRLAANCGEPKGGRVNAEWNATDLLGRCGMLLDFELVRQTFPVELKFTETTVP
jgi:hypothetical protein